VFVGINSQNTLLNVCVQERDISHRAAVYFVSITNCIRSYNFYFLIYIYVIYSHPMEEIYMPKTHTHCQDVQPGDFS